MPGLSGTKLRIFDETLKLIAENNYESVSMRDIAESVGIKASSIYNHYYSKQEILNHLYNYYKKHVFDKRLPPEEIKNLMETGNKKDIVDGFSQCCDIFLSESNRIIMLAKLIYQRIYCDERAAEIYLDTYNENTQYIYQALLYGIEIGRISAFPALGYANSLVSQYAQLAVNSFIDTKDSLNIKLATSNEIREWMALALPIADGK